MDSRANPEPTGISGGEAYEPLTGRWSRLVASQFLRWLDVQSNGSWLDVGCGTGALIRAILETENPREVVGIDPSSEYIAYARREINDERVRYEVGEARDMPVASNQYDAVVSGLVLNVLAPLSQGDAICESARAARRGGRIGAYVWDYAEGMEPRVRFWEAATDLDPLAAAVDQRSRFPLCRPDMLTMMFERGGLNAVRTCEIVIKARFDDFDDYWTPYLGGNGDAGAYVSTLTEQRRNALRDRLRETLPIAEDGSISLPARAWAVKGVK